MARIASPSFIGRAGELARLGAALGRARAGTPTTVLLGGEAGIGKTRLLARFKEELPPAEGIVLIGGCPPVADTQLAFASVVEALRSLRRQLTPAELDDVLGSARAQIARLLPSLAIPDAAGSPGSDQVEGHDSAQTYLFEGILGLLERLGEARGCVVLVLEDLQWADRSTRELLAFLVRNLGSTPVLLIGTYRADAIPTGHPLRTLLAELERSDRVERFELSRFERDEMRAQLKAILGSEPDPAMVDEVHGRSDGNPFFAEELTAAKAAGGTDRLPETLRETLLARINAAPLEVQELLRMGAVAGRRFGPAFISVVTPFEEPVLIAALREAVRSHFLVAVRDVSGEGFEFRHGLMREAIYEDIVPGERGRRHELVAAGYEANPHLQAGTPALREAELAHHWLAAGDAERALPVLIRSGLAAEDAYAFPEAGDAFEAALRIWDRATAGQGPDHAAGPAASPVRLPIGFRSRMATPDTQTSETHDRADVMRHAGEAASLTGSPARAVELTRAILEGIDSTVDPFEASLAQERLGRYLWEDGDGDGALEAYGRAAELALLAVPSAGQARVLGAYARALVNAGRYTEGRVACDQAIAVGLAWGADSEVRRARETLGVALAFTGEVEVGLQQLVESRKRAQDHSGASIVRPRPSRIGDAVRGFADLAAVLERAGRPDEAAAVSMEGSARARELGVEATWGNTLEIQATIGLYHLGDWDEAERMTRRLLAGGLRGAPAARLHIVRARLETGRGAFDDAALHLAAARVHLPGHADPTLVGELSAATAELAIWQRHLGAAREAVDQGLVQLHQGEDQLPVAQLCWLGVRAEADRSESARDRRASAEAVESHEVAACLRAELVGIGQRLSGRTHLAPRELRVFPALLEAEWSRLDGGSDPDQWAAAAGSAGAVKDPWLAAYAHWREAEAALPAKGGRARAEPAFHLAYASALALGAETIRRELEALARRARIDLVALPPTDGPPESTQVHPDRFGLTAREREVLGLVAEGRTNRQIATELFITEKTAGHHVSNLLAKLDAATRVEAAAIAHRLGLLTEVRATPDR